MPSRVAPEQQGGENKGGESDQREDRVGGNITECGQWNEQLREERRVEVGPLLYRRGGPVEQGREIGAATIAQSRRRILICEEVVAEGVIRKVVNDYDEADQAHREEDDRGRPDDKAGEPPPKADDHCRLPGTRIMKR